MLLSFLFVNYLFVSVWNAQEHRERLPRDKTGEGSRGVRKCAVWMWMSVIVFDKDARMKHGAGAGGHVIHLRSALYGRHLLILKIRDKDNRKILYYRIFYGKIER